MKHLDPLSKSKPRELDRKMWADIDRLMYTVQAKGRGEYFFDDPIFFGTAFTSPPTLSYSSITDGSVGEEVIPYRCVPSRDVRKDLDIYHLGNFSLGANNGPILDPGFEIQGQFVPSMGEWAEYIPVTSDLPTSYASEWVDGEWVGPPALWGGYGKECWTNWPNVILGYWLDHGFSAQNGMGYRNPEFINSWVQTSEVRGRWSVTNVMSHDYGVGYRGDYSAEFTFEDEGASPWLIPLGWQANYTEELGPDNPATSHWSFFSLQMWGGQNMLTGVPPTLSGWNGTAAVWSDDDCELDVWHYSWWLSEGWEGSEPAEYGTWDAKYWDYTPMPISYDDSTPMVDSDVWDDYEDRYGNWQEQSDTWITCHLSGQSRQSIPIKGGTWNEVSFHIPYHQNQWHSPGLPDGHPLFVEGPGWMMETFRFRINGGSPGQVVRLDNVYVWPDLKNVYVPMVTVGVAEWVQDEQGAYIGAKLWVKVGEPSDQSR